MYSLCVNKEFISIHFLLGENRGSENKAHTHSYKVCVELAGESLNKEGFLIDIVVVEEKLLALVSVFENKVLNDLPFFKGLNPSIENFARIVCQELHKEMGDCGLNAMKVTIHEDTTASASYRLLL